MTCWTVAETGEIIITGAHERGKISIAATMRIYMPYIVYMYTFTYLSEACFSRSLFSKQHDIVAIREIDLSYIGHSAQLRGGDVATVFRGHSFSFGPRLKPVGL